MDNYKIEIDLEVENSHQEKIGNTDLTIESVAKNIIIQYKMDVEFESWGIDAISIFGAKQLLSFKAELSQPLEKDDSGYVDEDLETYDFEIEVESDDFTIEEDSGPRKLNSQIKPDRISLKLYDLSVNKLSRLVTGKAKATLYI